MTLLTQSDDARNNGKPVILDFDFRNPAARPMHSSRTVHIKLHHRPPHSADSQIGNNGGNGPAMRRPRPRAQMKHVFDMLASLTTPSVGSNSEIVGNGGHGHLPASPTQRRPDHKPNPWRLVGKATLTLCLDTLGVTYDTQL